MKYLHVEGVLGYVFAIYSVGKLNNEESLAEEDNFWSRLDFSLGSTIVITVYFFGVFLNVYNSS